MNQEAFHYLLRMKEKIDLCTELMRRVQDQKTIDEVYRKLDQVKEEIRKWERLCGISQDMFD